MRRQEEICGQETQDDSDYADSDDDEEDAVLTSSNPADIRRDIASYITRLFEATPLVQRFIDRLEASRLLRTQIPIESFSISGPAHTYVSLVKDHFQNISPQLADRLGQANWQRHQELRISATKEDVVPPPVDDAPQNTFRDSGYESRRPRSSQYAISVKSCASHSSFKSTDSAATAGRPRVPSAPPAVLIGDEPCPYCYKTVELSNRIEWK